MARAEKLGTSFEGNAASELTHRSVAFDGTAQFKFKGSSANGLRREIVRACADRSLMSGVNLNAGWSQ